MKKKQTDYDEYEVNLIDLITIFWKKKIIIILITLISFLIGTFYNYNNQQSPYYEFTLELKKSGEDQFYKFLILKDILSELQFDQNVIQGETSIEIPRNLFAIDPNIILIKFIEELMDYEEIIFVWKKNNLIKKKISKFSENDQQVRLYKYARSFKIEEVGVETKKIYLKFNWHNKNEGIKILDDVMKFTLKNFNSSVFENLEYLLELKENKSLMKDLQRIDYLLEQSELARELNIAENQVDTFNMPSESSVLFNINTNNVAYYLRGYKAIDKEISIIRNRNYQDLVTLENQIKSIKKTNTKWIDYNIFLVDTKLLIIDKSEKILILCTIIGLIIGLIVALTINSYQSRIITKKK